MTLVFNEDVDVSRGDVIAALDGAPALATRLRADLVWLDAAPLMVGRRYALRVGPKQVHASVAAIEHVRDVHSGGTHAAPQLALNAIGRVELVLEAALPLARFEDERALGAFILIDRATNATAGAGTIVEAIAQGAERAYAQAFSIGPAERAKAKGQQARCVWLTGLSGAGKSTLADALERRLHAEGRHTMLLDGDNVRRGISNDLGFAPEDRREHVRRLGEVAKLMVDAGLVVIVSAISPYRADREAVRARFAPGEFIEVFVDASPATCAARDPKGLYAKAQAGGLSHAIGVGGDYEPPPAPEQRCVHRGRHAGGAGAGLGDMAGSGSGALIRRRRAHASANASRVMFSGAPSVHTTSSSIRIRRRASALRPCPSPRLSRAGRLSTLRAGSG